MSMTKVCRICLSESSIFQSIFLPTPTNTNILLSDMIMSLASVQITLGDGLPDILCLDCIDKLCNTHKFKIRCEQSDKLLRERLIGLDNSIQQYDDQIIPKSEEVYLDDPTPPPQEPSIVLLENISEYVTDCGERKFKCGICLKTFNQSNVNRHIKIHAALKEHECDACGKQFSRRDLLTRHRKIHEEQLDVRLTAIKAEVSPPTVKIDVADDDKKDTIACDLCAKRFSTQSVLNRHMKSHAYIKAHACLKCGKAFARADQLTSHTLNIHSDVKTHACPVCAKGFSKVSGLKEHMRSHASDSLFVCSICGKSFSLLSNLRQHAVRHTGVKAHLCNICGSTFASRGKLTIHLRRHSGVRPFACPVCTRAFTTSSSLKEHHRIHSGEKPYVCDVCQRKFSRLGILTRHQRTHTGEKPYVCKFCAKAFAQSNDLQSHTRIHTGARPFSCDTCGQAFRQRSALKTHQKVHAKRT